MVNIRSVFTLEMLDEVKLEKFYILKTQKILFF